MAIITSPASSTQITGNLTSQAKSSSMYFAPPPTTEQTAQKLPKKTKPAPLLKLAATRQAQRISSTGPPIPTSTPIPSRQERFDDEEEPMPAINVTAREWTLISILLLAFITAVLGTIYADCVALPHTDKNPLSYLDSNQTALANSTDPASASTGISRLLKLRASPDPSTYQGQELNYDNVTLLPTAVMDLETKQLGYTKPGALAALFFYTAALPLLSIMHVILELMARCCISRPSSSSSYNKETASDSDNDTDSITALKRLAPPLRFATTLKSTITTHLPAFSLTSTISLIVGWILITSIQMNCEIPLPSNTDSNGKILPSSEKICPVQVRGHFMYGIHELSMAKVGVAWCVCLLYIGVLIMIVQEYRQRRAGAGGVKGDVEAKKSEKHGGIGVKSRMEKRLKRLSNNTATTNNNTTGVAGGKGRKVRFGAGAGANGTSENEQGQGHELKDLSQNQSQQRIQFEAPPRNLLRLMKN